MNWCRKIKSITKNGYARVLSVLNPRRFKDLQQLLEKFQGELKLHSEEQQKLDKKRTKQVKLTDTLKKIQILVKKDSKGFKILQFFQDRFTLEKKLR